MLMCFCRSIMSWFLLWELMLTCLLGLSNQTLPKQDSFLAYDCSHIRAVSPDARNGIYMIQPTETSMEPFEVYCEMRPDGAWTVIQRRTGGALCFSRGWVAYKKGFGDLNGDHWLGLSKVHSISETRKKRYTLRVDLWDHEGGSSYAEYSNFTLGGENEAFKLKVGTYRGNAGDAIRGAYPGIDQNGFGFSTMDNDNDGCSPCLFGDIAQRDCSSMEGGGWWFSRCGSANLNGDWHPAGDHLGWASGLHWRTWKGPAPYSAKATRIMIKSS